MHASDKIFEMDVALLPSPRSDVGVGTQEKRLATPKMIFSLQLGVGTVSRRSKHRDRAVEVREAQRSAADLRGRRMFAG